MGEIEEKPSHHCEETGKTCDWLRLYFKQMKLVTKAEEAILEMVKENQRLKDEKLAAEKERDRQIGILAGLLKFVEKKADNGDWYMDGTVYEGDMLTELDRLQETEIEVVSLKVVEAEGYVCGLQWTDERGYPCMAGYGYSYWSLMKPHPEHGDEVVMLILRKKTEETDG